MHTEKKTSVSVIVPAYNEAQTVARVLKKLRSVDVIDEVIAINDGSTDETLKEMNKVSGIFIINYKKNHGKGHAVSAGIRRAQGEIILLIDADAISMNGSMINKMLTPLITHVADGVIGYPDSIVDKFFIPLCGQRAYFKKDLEPHLDSFEKKGYGLELYLNYLYSDRETKNILLTGLNMPYKYKKQSADTATKMYLVELLEILHEIARQEKPSDYFNRAYLKPFKKVNGSIDDFSARTFLKKLKERVNQ